MDYQSLPYFDPTLAPVVSSNPKAFPVEGKKQPRDFRPLSHHKQPKDPYPHKNRIEYALWWKMLLQSIDEGAILQFII